jgi:4-oxalocrotonate tautomerase
MRPTADTTVAIYFQTRGAVFMPYVNVRITKDGVTTDQKRQIVKEMTDTLVRVLGKRPEHTHIIIDEVEPENWGFAGMLTTEYRKSQD